MLMIYVTLQQSEPWHRQGLFMGMHWAWWLFWIGAAVLVAWVLLRLVADRRECQARARELVAAEDLVRHRFASGEIGEGELADSMRALRASRS